jgi:hypothetical protein
MTWVSIPDSAAPYRRLIERAGTDGTNGHKARQFAVPSGAPPVPAPAPVIPSSLSGREALFRVFGPKNAEICAFPARTGRPTACPAAESAPQALTRFYACAIIRRYLCGVVSSYERAGSDCVHDAVPPVGRHREVSLIHTGVRHAGAGAPSHVCVPARTKHPGAMPLWSSAFASLRLPARLPLFSIFPMPRLTTGADAL